MNERLVFFCDRDRQPGYLYRLGATQGASSYLYQVYCRSALDETLPEPPGQRMDAARLVELVAAAGGGLVAETRQTGDLIVLSVQTALAEGYEPARAMVLLAPGQEPKQVSVDGRGITLVAGELALVPATAVDQANLAALIEHIERLPGDYRGLVLDVLRQPGIDGTMRRLMLRVDGLLAQLGGTPAEGIRTSAPGSQRGAPLAPGTQTTDIRRAAEETPKARMGGFWPWLLAGLLVLNLAGVAAGVWFLPKATAQRISSKSTEPTAYAECKEVGEPSPWKGLYANMLEAQDKRFQAFSKRLTDCESKLPTAAGAINPAQAEGPKQAINQLIEDWMIHAYAWPETEKRQKIAFAHFSDRNGNAIYRRDWLNDRAGGAAAPYFRRQERILYALAKLMLVTNGIPIESEETTLAGADQRNKTKRAIKQGLEGKGTSPRLNDEDRYLLAWLACEIFPSGLLTDKAQLVRVTQKNDPDATTDGDKDDEGPVDLGLACNAKDDAKVLAAIQRYRDALTSSAQ